VDRIPVRIIERHPVIDNRSSAYLQPAKGCDCAYPVAGRIPLRAGLDKVRTLDEAEAKLPLGMAAFRRIAFHIIGHIDYGGMAKRLSLGARAAVRN